MITREESDKLVEEAMDRLFHDALGIGGATSGDMDPLQDSHLEDIKNRLSLLLYRHVESNCETPIFQDNIYTRRPSFVRENLNYVNEHCMMKMENVSYKNDVTDSIGNQILSIYLPNSSVTDVDQERFHQYMIRLNDGLKDTEFATCHEKLFDTIGEVVIEINKVFG